jgi:hypothetical protein
MLFKEIIPIYSENQTKHECKMQSYWLLKQDVHSYHWALKG